MFCTNCGTKIRENSEFCSNCGFKFNNEIKKSKQKSTIVFIAIILVCIISLGIGYVCRNISSNGVRTVMIYMSGSNLESDNGVATSEINSIDPTKIDLTKTNILLYTGGTEKWFNFVDSNENAIYKLEIDGFKKVKTYPTDNMGDSKTFSTFLNYAYDNYKADKYDLIIWDHGLAALGSMQDDINNDFLDTSEMKVALENSRFSKKDKMETVFFSTCLNATAEIASVYDDFAHYMVASEEITIGASGVISELNYLNDITFLDDGYSAGNMYINSYQRKVNESSFFKIPDSTYSIINLDKFYKLEKALDKFFSNIDLNKNYAMISRVRKNLHQYAVDTSNEYNYDTVDLYQLINEIKDISPRDAEKLLKIINEVVEYNWSTNDYSNGISIYFPYYGVDYVKKMHFNIYDKIDFSSNYKKFIKQFDEYKNTNSVNYSIDVFSNKIVSSDKTLQLQLTEEQLSNYAGARYILFRKTYSDEGFYKYFPLIRSFDVSIDDNGLISANVDNKLLKVVDKSSGDSDYISVIDIKDSKVKKYQATAMIGGYKDDPLDLACIYADFEFDDNNKPYITRIIRCPSDLEIDNTALNLNDWEYFSWLTNGYRILDNNGNYMENWPENKIMNGWDVYVKDLDFESASLDLNGKDEYYGIFQIYDIYGNYSYSNLIKIK